MPFTARKSGLNVSVFSVGGTEYLCDLDNASLSVEVEQEDARGVCDEWAFAWATSKSWSIDAELFVSTVAALMTDIIGGDALVTVSFNSGANTYTGTGLLTSGSHSAGKSGLQKLSIKIQGQGALAVA
jgi:hypothetical protein